MRATIPLLLAGALTLGQQACNRDAKSRTAQAGADTSMAGMPGMTGDSARAAVDSNSVTLTAAQIAHGRIAWTVPGTRTASGSSD